MRHRTIGIGIGLLVLACWQGSAHAQFFGGDSGGGGGGGGSNVSVNSTSEANPNFLNSLDILWTNVSGAVRAWFAPTINVKAAPYNAVCDGVTDDRAAIQAAIDAAPSYATIVIDGSSGLCALGASSDTSVRSLRVNAKTGITFEGRKGGGFVTLDSVGTYGWAHTLMGVRTAILVQDSTQITFRNLEFRGNRDGQPLVVATSLSLATCTGCTVERSIFVRGGGYTSGNISAQLVVRGGSRNKVTRSEFYNSNVDTNYARCIWFGDNTASARVETDSEISHNYIYNCGHSAIVFDGIGALIQGNSIHYPTTTGWNGSGMSLASSASGSVTLRRVRVLNNYIQGAPYQGIQLYAPTASDAGEDESFVISGNIIVGGGGAGIYLLNAQHTQVSNNILQDNVRGIYALGHAHDLNISDNTIWDSRSGDSRTMLYGIWLAPGSGGSFAINHVLIANNRVTAARDFGIQVSAGPTSSESVSHIQVVGNVVRDTVPATGGAFGDGIHIAGPGVATNVVVRGNVALGSARSDLRIGNVAAGSSVIVEPDSNIYVSSFNLGYASVNTLTVNSATPSVQYLALWREANTSSTTITNLTDGRDGQTIRIYFTSTNTTIQHGSNISLGSGANFTGQVGDILELQRVGSTWREVSRSRWATGGGGSSAFNDITSGTNTSATMTVGTGGTLTYSGSGTVNASQFRGNSTVALAHGGTNQTTWTANRCVRVNSGGTALESASSDCGSGGIGGSTGSTDNAVLRADGTGGSTLQSSACTISDTGVMTCAGFASTGSGNGITLLEGTAPGAGSSAGEHNVYFDSSDSLLKSHQNGGSVVTYHSTAYAMAFEDWNDVAGCVGTTAGHVWDAPSSGAPEAICDPASTNTTKGLLAFDDSTDEAVHVKFRLPTGFTGAIDFIIRYKMASATSGTVGWCVQLARVPTGSTSDPSLPAQASGNCASQTVPGTAGQESEVTISGVTCTSCAAGDLIYGAIGRDANGSAVSDSATGDARLIGFVKRVRRTM
jgi:parallel beta-helix repeat protein